jgi:hypothetical protein
MPPEVLASPEIAQEGWVFQQLPKMTKVLMEMGIAEAAFPSMEKIEGTDGFLVVLWPEFDRLSFWSILGHTVLTTVIIILAKLGFNLAANHWTAITKMCSNTWNYIF